jgi:hypothetical protein
MKQIIVTTQAQLDAIKEVKVDEEVVIEVALTLNAKLYVFGRLSMRANLNCSWNGRCVVARENSSVVARGHSSVEAWGHSFVEAWENSSVVARGHSSVVARGNSSVVARGNSIIRVFKGSVGKLSLSGFSILSIPFDLKLAFKKTKTVVVQKYKSLPYFEREGIAIKSKAVVLYKRVSENWKTQENTKNETTWTIGSTLEHPAWSPKNRECGEGKYHACSRPYFCDEFQSEKGDHYIAIKIMVADLYEWPNAQYPHKIAFRKCTVLYECDKFGKKIEGGN